METKGTWEDGVVALSLGQVERAVEVLEAAVRAEPHNAAALHHLGVAYARQGRCDESIAVLGRAISLAPRDAAAHFDLGEVYRQLGRASEARQAYQQALHIDPSHAAARQEIAALPLPGDRGGREPLRSAPVSTVPARSERTTELSELPPPSLATPTPARAAPTTPDRREETAAGRVGLGQLCLGALFSPRDALKEHLPHYLRGPGAVLKIALFYAVCMIPAFIVHGMHPATMAGQRLGRWAASRAPLEIVSSVPVSVLAIIAGSVLVAFVNLYARRGDGFLQDAAQLGLGFALVGGITHLIGYSVELAAIFTTPAAASIATLLGVVTLATGLCTLLLYVRVVTAACEYPWIGAALLVFAAVAGVGIIAKPIL